MDHHSSLAAHHHTPQHQRSATMPSFPPPPPPAAQPPVQIPYSDPFHNHTSRDPFLPQPQHRRKESYGGLPTPAPLAPPLGAERSWSGQQGQQFSQASHGNSPHHPSDHHPAQPYDNARRRSIGSAASPPRYAGGPLEPPPPPPPSYGPRNMPPPSPSSSNGSSFPNSHPARGPVSTSPFGSARESTFATRPGGGLSIGSLIGNERPTNDDRGPKPATTQNSPTFRPTNSLSPKRARSTSMRSDFGRVPRPLSPRSSLYGGPGIREDYDRSIFRPAPASHFPQGPMNPQSFRPYQSSPASAGEHSHSQQSNGLPAPPRPNSQPTISARQDRVDPWQPPPVDQHNPEAYREHPPHVLEQQSSRPFEDAPMRSHEPAAQPSNPYVSNPARDERDELPRHPYAPDRRHEYDERRLIDTRSGFGGPTSSPTPSDNMGFESRFRHYGGPPPDRDRESIRPGVRRDDDGHPIPRSLLTVSPELNRREGRSSPLPQAVQGAQPRLMGPGRDSSIKYEFGRMFSGLGSGVGGAGTPTGSFSARGDVTPSRLSPSRFAGAEHGQSGEVGGVVNGTSMLHRNERDIESRDDLDEMNGRSTPTGQGKANKRMKTAHVPHHHHHHAHAHHHHHHHHPTPDDNVNPRSGFSTLRFPPNSNSQAQPPPAMHHHHHHIHTNHHHHHPAKAVSSPTIPEVSVLNGDVLAHVDHLPRSHLGSSLYESMLSIPPGKRVLLDTRLMFSSSSQSMPCFDGKENCTFTVRVPREYLIYSDSANADDQVAGGMEEICKRRAIWGSEIYTDDSDVVAA
ncbi:hypothetical protein K461DRAFT_312083, partial [Myriangium duriaei CBS 260.36]